MYYSVGTYKNVYDNTLFSIPDGFDQYGIRTNVNKPAVLKEPYKLDLIGTTLRECFEITINRQYTDEDMKCRVMELVTGEKRVKKIINNHHFQWVFFHKDEGYIFEASMKSKDGRGYDSIPNISPLALDHSADNIELGITVLQIFETCK